MNTIEIKLLDEAEFPSAIGLVRTVFDEFEAPDYSSEGVEAFYRFIEPANLLEFARAHRLLMWGAFENEALVGVIAARSGCHICLLFVDKAHHRKGIARKLMWTVIEDCRQQGAPFITVNSSPYALEAYLAMGFSPTDSEQTINGIRFIPMRYSMSPSQCQ